MTSQVATAYAVQNSAPSDARVQPWAWAPDVRRFESRRADRFLDRSGTLEGDLEAVRGAYLEALTSGRYQAPPGKLAQFLENDLQPLASRARRAHHRGARP
jgi:hypothetical protein